MLLNRIGSQSAEIISTSADLEKAFLQQSNGPSSTGLSVNPDNARGVTAYFSCIRILAETVGQVPLEMYKRKSNGGRERATDHPLYGLLHRKPNKITTSYKFRETLQGHSGGVGNGYAFINRVNRGKTIKELIQIHPNRVEPKVTENTDLFYKVRLPNGETRDYQPSDILHIKGLSGDGVTGYSPVRVHREALGLSLATERHGAKLFANGVQLSGAFTHPDKLGDIAYERLRASLGEYTGVDNALKNMILEEGMKWEKTAMTSEDAQFIESRKYQVEEVARIFRIPLLLLQAGDKAPTFASSEQFLIVFVKFTMAPWFVNWEQELTTSLLTKEEQEDYYFEFNIDGLLRGDSKARSAFYKDGILSGWLMRNEARKKENMEPVDGLDEPIQPANSIPVDDAQGAPDDEKTEDNN